MTNLIDYLKAQGVIKVEKVNQGNGAFLICIKKDFVSIIETPKLSFTMPIGNKSKEVAIADLNVLITEDNVAIATGRNVLEVMEL